MESEEETNKEGKDRKKDVEGRERGTSSGRAVCDRFRYIMDEDVYEYFRLVLNRKIPTK